MKCDGKVTPISCSQADSVPDIQNEASSTLTNNNIDYQIETNVRKEKNTKRRISTSIVSIFAFVIVLAVVFIIKYWPVEEDSTRYVKSVCNFSEGLAWIES